MGNPLLFSLIDAGGKYIMVVQNNPINIGLTLTTSHETRDRINTLSFNSSLMPEMCRIDFVDPLLDRGVDLGKHFRKIFIHQINLEEEVQAFNISSKFNTRTLFYNTSME